MAPENDSLDPFSDRAAITEHHNLVAESTLDVGRNATLTLGTDSLIVLDGGLRDGDVKCCGLLHQGKWILEYLDLADVLKAPPILDLYPTTTSSGPTLARSTLRYTMRSLRRKDQSSSRTFTTPSMALRVLM